MDMVADLEVAIGEKIPLNDEEALNAFLIAQCEKHDLKCDDPKTNARLYDKLVGHFLESQAVNPTFLINHPRFMSPLAKWHRKNRNLSERFELFVANMELCNAYTELNHPKIQADEFQKQVLARNQGDSEAQDYDHSFVEALEFGLPPTGGFGMGIDRLVMLLTNRSTIKDVVLFPVR
jgi:lysyl-tRNA synthetase class 2